MIAARARVLPILMLCLPTTWAESALAQVTGYAEITAPQTGGVVSQIVTLTGTADHPWFQAYDLAFAYQDNPTGTWFPIGEPVQTPVADGRLGIWDTTTIADGIYALRLRVWLQDGTVLTALVEDVRVRNYLPVETPTPAATALPTPIPVTPSPSPTSWPTPTATPEPAGLAQARAALNGGALAAVVGLGGLGLYSWVRSRLRSRWGMIRNAWMHRADRRRSGRMRGGHR